MSISGSVTGGVYLLDSGVLIRSLRGDATMKARMDAAARLYVPGIVLGELYFGAYSSPTRADAARAKVDHIARTIVVLPTDAATAEVYGRIKQEQRAKGQMLPENDFGIAAVALQNDLTLAAWDAHFNLISGLRYEMW